jgi:hypothetical protein
MTYSIEKRLKSERINFVVYTYYFFINYANMRKNICDDFNVQTDHYGRIICNDDKYVFVDLLDSYDGNPICAKIRGKYYKKISFEKDNMVIIRYDDDNIPKVWEKVEIDHDKLKKYFNTKQTHTNNDKVSQSYPKNIIYVNDEEINIDNI